LVLRARDWRYSSAEFYMSDGTAKSEVMITPIDWT
jgi:hypothetical protein